MLRLLPFLLLPALAGANGPLKDKLEAGMKAQRAGQVEAAVDLYKGCLRDDPEFVPCHWELGWAYYTRNDWAGVVQQWRTVKRLQPDHPEVDEWLPQAEQNLVKERELAAAILKAPETARPPLPAGKTLRLRLVGDVMMGTTSPHPTQHLPPDDGAHYFDPVRDLLVDADLTFANLEGPLCDTTRRAAKCVGDDPCYAFKQPTRYAKHLQEAGFDLVSIANNHMLDFDQRCRDETTAALDAANLAWSGPPMSIASVEHGDFKVAMIAFHTARHSNYVNDHENAKRLVQIADHSHDLVIVSFHGGAEGRRHQHVPNRMETFYGEPRGHLRKFARDVIGAGADLVVGHGPHVLRGMEVIDGRLAAYSLGNFATYDRFNLAGVLGVTAVLEVELDHEGRLLRGRILPVVQVDAGIPQPDPDQRAIAILRELSLEDFPQTAPTIAQDGSFAPK